MILADKYYKRNIEEILFFGSDDENPRPKWPDGTPAHSKFIGPVFEMYDLMNGEFPITTLRNTAVFTGIKEIFWIYQHQSNCLEKANELGISWWDSFDIGNRTIGNRYGHTVRKHNLMNDLLKGLEENPFGRRHIIDLYQHEDLNSTPGLHPCAFMTMWSVRKSKSGVLFLDMTLVQRSNDYIVAGYINKIQYVAFQMMVAGHLGYMVGTFSHLVQNLHIYDRHMDAADEILKRGPMITNPKLLLLENKNFYDYTIEDFKLEGVEGIQKLSSKLEIAI